MCFYWQLILKCQETKLMEELILLVAHVEELTTRELEMFLAMSPD
jgi:hypothetical protein